MGLYRLGLLAMYRTRWGPRPLARPRRLAGDLTVAHRFPPGEEVEMIWQDES